VHFPFKKSLCCTYFSFLELHVEEQSGPACGADAEQQAKAFQDAPPSLLDVVQEAGADTAVEAKTAEVRQLHKHWDKLSWGGGSFLTRPSSCCACSWQPISGVFGVPPPPAIIES